MSRDLSELAGNGSVNIFEYIEIGWEKDVKVSLVNLEGEMLESN
jgi:hypothetical protein